MSYGFSSATGGLGQGSSANLGKYAQPGQKLAGGYKQGQLPLYTPEQMQLFQQQFAHTAPESFLSKLASGDQEIFNEVEAPALRQFNQTLGGIASRFSKHGARKSSGFQNYTTAAASNLAQDLQANRQALQQQALKDLMGMSNTILGQKPYFNYATKNPKQNWFQKFMGAASPIAGAAIGGYFGGPMGMAAGSQFGNAFGAGFGGDEYGGMDFSGLADLPTSWNQGRALAGARGYAY